MASQHRTIAERNNETGVTAREDDTPDPRWFWYVKLCPDLDNCSAASFKRANVWSYQSAKKCLCYLKQHLMSSSKHNMTDDEAEECLLNVSFEMHSESYQERESHRVSIERGGAEPYVPPQRAPASSQLQSVSKAPFPAATILAPRPPQEPPYCTAAAQTRSQPHSDAAGAGRGCRHSQRYR